MTSVHIIDGPKIPFEPEALDQFHRVAASPGCCHAAAMPDLHAGPGVPVGACFAFDHVRPALVGSDAGCGVLMFAARAKHRGDVLERRLDDEETFGGDASVRAFIGGPRALAEDESLPASLRSLAGMFAPDSVGASPRGPLPPLGIIGGGNHFAEVGEVDEVVDPYAASGLGWKRGLSTVLVHSGSGSHGAALAARWAAAELRGEEVRTYLSELEGAVRLARANRLVLAWRLLRALGAARASRIRGHFDLIHNTVVPRPVHGLNAFVHRKGCAPAEAEQPTVVLGSRGTHSWVLLGTGNEAGLASVAHGAGRRMTRSDARARFKTRGARKNLTRTALGGRVLCRDPKLLYEEHPEAYKAIGPVVDAVVAHGLARRLCSHRPVLTVKR